MDRNMRGSKSLAIVLMGLGVIGIYMAYTGRIEAVFDALIHGTESSRTNRVSLPSGAQSSPSRVTETRLGATNQRVPIGEIGSSGRDVTSGYISRGGEADVPKRGYYYLTASGDWYVSDGGLYDA